MDGRSGEDAQFAALWARFLGDSGAAGWLLGLRELRGAGTRPEVLVGAGGAAAGTLHALEVCGTLTLGALIASGDASDVQRAATARGLEPGTRTLAAFALRPGRWVHARFGTLRPTRARGTVAVSWAVDRLLPVPDAALAPQPRSTRLRADPPCIFCAAGHCPTHARPTRTWRAPAPLPGTAALASQIDAALAAPGEAGGRQRSRLAAPAAAPPARAAGVGKRGSAGGSGAAAATGQQCNQCGAVIRGKRGNLNRHIAARHSQLREHLCWMPGCGLAFQSKLNLARHMTGVHEAREHACAQCPRAFAAARTLARHVRAAHDPRRTFACPACPLSFGRRSVLANHTARVHAGRAPPTPPARRPRAFRCRAPACSAAFPSWQDARAHEDAAHAGRVHHCPGCERVFDAEAALSRHIRTDHAATESSRSCPVCGSVHSDRSNLLRHMSLAHKGEGRESGK